MSSTHTVTVLNHLPHKAIDEENILIPKTAFLSAQKPLQTNQLQVQKYILSYFKLTSVLMTPSSMQKSNYFHKTRQSVSSTDEKG